ncbi:hypothetical protein AcW1_004620 [Taiwanofungus camphoratus]|nr:hypothetical protein AcW1_004620 [Antrodia cinnamomea]
MLLGCLQCFMFGFSTYVRVLSSCWDCDHGEQPAAHQGRPRRDSMHVVWRVLLLKVQLSVSASGMLYKA